MKYSLLILSLCFALDAPAPLLAQTAKEKAQTSVGYDEELRASVAYWASMLARHQRLVKKGVTSAAKVDDIQATLCKLRHDLASFENDVEAEDKQTRLLLEIRERKAKRWKKLHQRGYASEYQFNEAERQLAVTRFLVAQIDGQHDIVMRELQRIVKLCEEEVALREQALLKKTTVRVKLNWARSRLVCAKYQLAKLSDQSDETIPEFRLLAEALKHDWEQLEEQYEQRHATFVEVYFSHAFYINALLRQKNLEGKSEVMEELLRQQIKLHEDVLKKGRGALWSSHYTVRAKQTLDRTISKQLEHDRKRLERVLSTGELGDDLTLAELDP